MKRLRDNDDAEDLASSHAPSHVARSTAQPRPAVVMIADDTTDIRELYAEYFRIHGFTVVTAHDGASAVEVALEHQPDVIVMDLAMPQFDGIAAIRKLKENDRTRRSRVILLTGFPMTYFASAARAVGADLYLTKPCLPDELERHVNELRPKPESAP